jgi:o-succinylbenzoate synthase
VTICDDGQLRTEAFHIPLRTRFRRVTWREGVLVEGPAGWGEFSPFPDYRPPYTARWYHAAWEAAVDGWPDPVRDRVAVNATVPAVRPGEATRIVERSGCRTVKVKVAEPGETERDDLDRVEAVRDALGPSGHIRVDANAAWDVGTALRRLRALDRFDLEYAEQPVATLDEMGELRRRSPVPLAVDEPLRLSDEPLAVARRLEGVADIVILKVQPLGGVRPALRVAEAAGLPAVVSSALETSVGLAAGLALAAALPELPHACGLGTLSMLEGDVTDDPLLPRSGELEVRRPDVSDRRVARWRPESDRIRELADRFDAARRAMEET